MVNPIVIAHHLIFTAYGWWLPNDPRGSSSRLIRNDVIAELGALHHGRKSVQPASGVIREFYREADERLKHDLLTFDTRARTVVAQAFSETASREKYTCWACAIMPDHVHLVVRRHKHLAEEMIATFQREAASGLRAAGRRAPDHPVWGGPGWKVFLDDPEGVRRTMFYVESNPAVMGLPPQRWAFVVPYNDWPLHQGHSPNSPYVKRLRADGRYTPADAARSR